MFLRAILILALSDATMSPLSAQESPKDIIAAHIRSQGYACDAPKSATRQKQASRPGEQAWLLTCENAAYLVRLVPDMAAIVEPIAARP